MSEAKIVKAERALVKSMGGDPRRFEPGSLEVVGRSAEWSEGCTSRGLCLHARSGLASREALDAYFDAVEAPNE